MESTRRGFLGAALGAGFLPGAAAATTETTGGLKVGVASYSLRGFSRKLAIARLKKLKVEYVNIKDVHLSMHSSLADVTKGAREFEKAGMKILGGGTVDFKKDDEADFRRKFDYAKAAGMPLMVIAPTAVTLPKLEKFVKEYDIKVALHNHGPEDKHFPTPESALALMKNLDPRMGLCIDLGHTARTGQDPVESIRQAGARLLDMHFKDLSDFKAKDSQVPIGEGKMPVVAIFRELRKMNYQGGVMIEFEADEEDPMPGLALSYGYLRGVASGLKG